MISNNRHLQGFINNNIKLLKKNKINDKEFIEKFKVKLFQIGNVGEVELECVSLLLEMIEINIQYYKKPLFDNLLKNCNELISNIDDYRVDQIAISKIKNNLIVLDKDILRIYSNIYDIQNNIDKLINREKTQIMLVFDGSYFCSYENFINNNYINNIYIYIKRMESDNFKELEEIDVSYDGQDMTYIEENDNKKIILEIINNSENTGKVTKKYIRDQFALRNIYSFKDDFNSVINDILYIIDELKNLIYNNKISLNDIKDAFKLLNYKYENYDNIIVDYLEKNKVEIIMNDFSDYSSDFELERIYSDDMESVDDSDDEDGNDSDEDSDDEDSDDEDSDGDDSDGDDSDGDDSDDEDGDDGDDSDDSDDEDGDDSDDEDDNDSDMGKDTDSDNSTDSDDNDSAIINDMGKDTDSDNSTDGNDEDDNDSTIINDMGKDTDSDNSIDSDDEDGNDEDDNDSTIINDMGKDTDSDNSTDSDMEKENQDYKVKEVDINSNEKIDMKIEKLIANLENVENVENKKIVKKKEIVQPVKDILDDKRYNISEIKIINCKKCKIVCNLENSLKSYIINEHNENEEVYFCSFKCFESFKIPRKKRS